MDSNIYCRTVHFLPLDSFDVNNILLAINLDDLANLLALIVTSNNLRNTSTFHADNNQSYQTLHNYVAMSYNNSLC